MTQTQRPNADAPRDEARTKAIYEEAERARAERNGDERAPDGEPPKRKRRGFRMWKLKLLLWLIVLLILLVAALYFVPRVRAALHPELEITVPQSISDLLPDEKMGYNKFDFSDAIIGEARLKADFVALEQDVTVTSRISQALANLALFEKTQLVHSYGTGVYTVDLSALDADDIALDELAQIVTVTIPHAKLAYVQIDVDRTEFEDTQKGFLAFGDIKLTPEQLNILEQSIDAAMREQLDTAPMLKKADELALSQVRALFEPLVKSVGKNHIVKVVME